MPSSVMHDFEEHLRQTEGLAPGTAKAHAAYAASLNRWLATRGVALLAASATDLRAYRQSLRKSSAGAWQRRLRALFRLYGWAMARGLCRSNPAAGLLMAPPEAMTPPGPPGDEAALERLLAPPRSQVPTLWRDHALLALMHEGGFSLAEVLQLRMPPEGGPAAGPERRAWQARNAQVGLVLRRDLSAVVVCSPSRSEREVIPLDALARNALNGYLPAARLSLLAGQGSAHVFVASASRRPKGPESAPGDGPETCVPPLARQVAWRRLEQRVRQAGLPATTPTELARRLSEHWLRSRAGTPGGAVETPDRPAMPATPTASWRRVGRLLRGTSALGQARAAAFDRDPPGLALPVTTTPARRRTTR